jgi:putative oxidoreductase|tara:strand:+ start:382 stop:810 length:429 start_codon:yes stop_codon:yes gene_type:complete
MTKALPLIARILIALVFIPGALFKLMAFDQTAGWMTSVGFPAASVFLVIGIAIEIIGGLSVLVGYKAEWGAAILAVFLLIATIVFHRNIGDPEQMAHFTKNLAVIGGLLLIIHFGSGPLSMDSKSTPKVEKISKDEGDSDAD